MDKMQIVKQTLMFIVLLCFASTIVLNDAYAQQISNYPPCTESSTMRIFSPHYAQPYCISQGYSGGLYPYDDIVVTSGMNKIQNLIYRYEPYMQKSVFLPDLFEYLYKLKTNQIDYKLPAELSTATEPVFTHDNQWINLGQYFTERLSADSDSKNLVLVTKLLEQALLPPGSYDKNFALIYDRYEKDFKLRGLDKLEIRRETMTGIFQNSFFYENPVAQGVISGFDISKNYFKARYANMPELVAPLEKMNNSNHYGAAIYLSPHLIVLLQDIMELRDWDNKTPSEQSETLAKLVEDYGDLETATRNIPNWASYGAPMVSFVNNVGAAINTFSEMNERLILFNTLRERGYALTENEENFIKIYTWYNAISVCTNILQSFYNVVQILLPQGMSQNKDVMDNIQNWLDVAESIVDAGFNVVLLNSRIHLHDSYSYVLSHRAYMKKFAAWLYERDRAFAGYADNGWKWDQIERDFNTYVNRLQNDAFPADGKLPAGWARISNNANADWQINADESFEGKYSLKSGIVSSSEKSQIKFNGYFNNGDIVFAVKVSSERDRDYFRFYIDNIQMVAISGGKDWQVMRFPVTAGQHTVIWSYEKDGSGAAGDDAAWIDAVQLPVSMPQAEPFLSTQPATSITASAALLNSSICTSGDNPDIYFQYGKTTALGNVTAKIHVVDAEACQNIFQSVSGLACGTTYYYRVMDMNGKHGIAKTFATLACESAGVQTEKYMEIRLTQTDVADALWDDFGKSFAAVKDEIVKLYPKNGLELATEFAAVKNAGYIVVFAFYNDQPLAKKIPSTYNAIGGYFELKIPETGRYSLSSIAGKESESALTYLNDELILNNVSQRIIGVEINSGGVSPGTGSVELPRTGQTGCWDANGAVISCAGTGQDAEIQAGSVWPVPRFTNMDGSTPVSGNIVLDKLTGLEWPRDGSTPTVGSCTGGAMNWQAALDYVKCLNNLPNGGYLGHNDWRLPNRNELRSIINYGQSSTTFWLNNIAQGFANVQGADYWSSTTYESNTNYAFCVDIIGGGVGFMSDKYHYFYVWPVRDGQSVNAVISLPQTGQTFCYNTSGSVIDCNGTGQDGHQKKGITWPNTRFTNLDGSTPINGDLVLDKLTGLMWSKNANLMKTRDPGFDNDATGSNGAVTWQHALDYVKKLNQENYGGYNDWRLPNFNELESILNKGQANNVVWLNNSAQGFMSVQLGGYWMSSSSNCWGNNYAWRAMIESSFVNPSLKSNSYYVWPVRGGHIEPIIIPAVTFLSENLPDGTYLSGAIDVNSPVFGIEYTSELLRVTNETGGTEATTKTWKFQNGKNSITGLKAVRVSADTGLGITQTEIAIGDVAANAEFTVSLPINPVHAGWAVKSSYWKFVDSNGNDVIITNSKTNQFWLKIRTNHPPAFSPLQLVSVAGKTNIPVSLPLLATDADGDTLKYMVNSGSRGSTSSVVNGIYTGTFEYAGTYEVKISVSDESGEMANTSIFAVITDEGRIGHFFNDVPYPADRINNKQHYDQYLAIHYLALKGIVIGHPDPENPAQRIFEPANFANQAEALGVIMKSAKERGLIELDAPARYLPNLITNDAANGIFENFSWAAQYALKAEQLGMIDSADTFDPSAPATRLWVARLIYVMLNLAPPVDAITNLDNYAFPDAASFDNPLHYDMARGVAFFGYLGSLGQNFNPASSMVRADIAVVASRILLSPSMTGITTNLTDTTVFGRTFPAVTYGATFNVTGIAGLAGYAILDDNSGGISEDWISHPQDYIKAIVIRAGNGIVAQKMVCDLAGAPVNVATNPPAINFNEIRNLMVILQDTKSGVSYLKRMDYAVLFPDRDGDGVRNDQDVWPDNPLFSADANANGLPDNADALFGIADKQAGDQLTIGGARMTYLEAVMSGKMAELAFSPTIAINPGSHNFGNVLLGSNSPAREFTISNNSAYELVVSGITLSGGSGVFTVTPGGANPCASLTPTIAANGNCTINVVFQPAAAGLTSTTLQIASNDAQTPTLTAILTGTGLSNATTALYGSFTNYGLYKYEGNGWSPINTVNPDNMTASGGILYADFANYGLYKYAEGNWTEINKVHPSNMLSSDGKLYSVFDSYGFYKYESNAWGLINSVNPDKMTVSGGVLYADFANYGLYKYAGGAWSQINTVRPTNMMSSDGKLYATFADYGFYQYDGTNWGLINSVNPDKMTVSGGLLYADFANYGLYKYAGGAWSQINSVRPTNMLSSGGKLYATFTGYGFYQYDNATGWNLINSVNPESMTVSGGILYPVFQNYGFYKYDGTNWTQINSVIPAKVVAGE